MPTRARTSGRSFTRVAAVALLVSAMLAAAGAGDGEAAKRRVLGKIRTGSETASVPAVQGAIATVTATCPSRSKAVSGGFSTSPVPNELGVLASRRSGRRAWTVSVQQTTNNAAPAQLTTFVYCDRRLRRAPAVSETFVVPVTTTDSATARCPRGHRAISGGFAIETDASFTGAAAVLESRRTAPRSWSLTAHGVNGPISQLRVTAYCTRRAGRLRQREGVATLPDFGQPVSTATAISSPCPRRVGARAGGFSIGTTAENVTVFESRRAGRRWRFSARNLGEPPTPLAALAYCS